MRIEALPTFLVAVLIMAASPGPAMALILRRASLAGFRAAVPTVLGVEVGLFCWALAAGAGLAALIAASEAAFIALRVLGAAVLIYLGVKAWRSAWALRRSSRMEALPEPPRLRGHHRAFGEALVVQVANPKAAVFLFAFYPQFLPAQGPVLGPTIALGAIQVAVETLLYLSLAAAVGSATSWFSRTKVRQVLEGTSGAVLIALGLRVALTSR
jgi:threonine/homoserine/homoserine lactone efflux protein